MKKIVCVLLVVISLLLTSCREDTTQIAKNEFLQYYNGEEEVVLYIDDNLFFEKREMSLNSLFENFDNHESNFNSLVVKQGVFFFSTTSLNAKNNFSFNVYKSNLEGTNINLIFTRDGYKNRPSLYTDDDVFYLSYYTNHRLDFDSYTIDRYIVSTQVYENVDSGRDCSLSDYYESKEQSKYGIEVIENLSPKKHGKFIVTDLETGVSNVIDDTYLKDTIYIESMEKFNYSPMRFDISNGHILLTYGIGAGDGWDCPHLVFEYNFELNALEYKLLAFPYDVIPVKIFYIG